MATGTFISIGMMDTVAVLQQPTVQQNIDTGQNVRTFTTYSTVYVKREGVNAVESAVAGKKTPVNQVDFIGRFDANVNPTWRCVVDGITFEITGVEPIDGRRRFMRISCKTMTV
jgi:SPP1 family predicted phage head-tail adaptor